VRDISILLENFARHIAIPWVEVAAPERVIFCIYNEKDERKVRARKDEFKLATEKSGHGWAEFDLTDSFAEWFSRQAYAESYYREPELLSDLLELFPKHIEKGFEGFLAENRADPSTVVAVTGVGSLFPFMKVRKMEDIMPPLVEGRLLVFFPGSREGTNYRLLNAYDGWNYQGVPITADKEY
jgi:hypothetical protein